MGCISCSEDIFPSSAVCWKQNKLFQVHASCASGHEQIPEDVEQAFMEGQFNAKLTDGLFNDVWMDYALETTENKTLKGTGGIIGLTLRGQALSRWFLARPVTTLYSTNYHTGVCQKKRKAQQTDHLHRKSTQHRWNADVKKMTDIFNVSFIDPFDLDDPPARLTNITTGAVASTDIEQSLLNALEKGTQMVKSFVTERLVPSNEKQTKSFYTPYKDLMLKQCMR